MKPMKKWSTTKQNKIKLAKRRSSADRLYTSSSVSAVTSLILMFAICSVANFFIVNHPIYADDPSISVSVDTISLNFMPTSSTPDFGESSAANISVSTTSASGYTLSIASSTGSTDLKSGSNTISSISSALSQSDFSSGTNYLNQWGYKPSSIYNSSTEQNTTNTNFLPLPDSNGAIIAKTNSANTSADSYSLSIGAKVNNTTPVGDYVSDTFIITAVSNSSVLPCDSTKLCVEYEGNGLTFDGELLNHVNYNSTTTSSTITKYSHTSNISDDGTQSGSYPSNLATKDVISIPGATSLHLQITYGTENNWDMLYVFEGEYTGTISRNMDQTSTGWLYKYMGGNNTTTTVDIDVSTSTGTVTLGFYSDGSSNYYGYYAIITGTASTLERTVASGEYATPTGTNSVFHGWSTSQTTPGGGLPNDVEYANESEVMANMPGEEGETKTLYAVWQQGQPITFNMDSNVSSIAVLDSSGSTVGTITASGQSLTLVQGDTYTIKPTHTTGYSTNAITKTSGAGTLSGKQFTVGAGTATISVTSKPLSPMQNFNCSSLAQGDTEEVYDTRDNEVYLIAKLADNNCWMLDNLRLDLGDSTVLNNTTSSNTNASDTYLSYLKNGGGSTSDKYPTAAVSYWTSSYSYSAPLVAIKNASDDSWNPDTVASVTYGEGSGKIGVYYNYCAASAGSYCWGNGTSYSGSPTSDPNTSSLRDIDADICPAGWRMPTSSSSGEYQALYGSYSSASEGQAVAFRNALSTPLSGGFNNGSAINQGSYGYFWSSTWSNTYGMYYLYVNSSGVGPSSYTDRGFGTSLRCVLGS